MTVYDWLTDEQRTVLSSRAISISWELRLKSWDGKDIGDFTDNLILSGSYIARDSSKSIQGRGHLTLADALDWRNSLACPIVTITDVDSGVEATWNMGVWIFRNPGRSLENEQLWETEIVDIVGYLGVYAGESWIVRDGTNIGFAVADVVRSPYPHIPYNFPVVPWELASDAIWPITEKVMWIDIANELLEASAHAALHATRYGVLTTYPWRPIADLTPIWRFTVGDKICWLREECERDPAPANAPNKWIGINRSVDNPYEGDGVYTIDRSGGDRVIPDVIEVTTVDQEALAMIVQHAQQDAILQENRLNLRTGLTPVFWHSDVVEVGLPGLDAGTPQDPVKGLVIGWKIDFDDGDMTSIVEVVP